MPASFLLIGVYERNNQWCTLLRDVLAPLGSLEVMQEESTLDCPLGCYDIVIVDAAGVRNVPSMVAHLRVERPQACVVVVTASPTWERAREAFQAGAADYIRKSLHRGELLAVVREVLSRPLSASSS
jgi:DNA-binding response OmpR family regulator